MNPLMRTVDSIIESTNQIENNPPKKLFQFISKVSGKRKNMPVDYELLKVDNWQGFETYLLSGRKGFIRLALTPLFKIEE